MKILKIIAKSTNKKALDPAMCTIGMKTVKEVLRDKNIKFLTCDKYGNKRKGLEYNKNNNSVALKATDVGLFGKQPKSGIPRYVPTEGKNSYIHKNKEGKYRVDVKSIMRYTFSQLIPSRARNGKLNDPEVQNEIKSLGLEIPEELLNDPKFIEKLANNDENAVETLLEIYDKNGTAPEFPLTDEGVLDLAPVSRGTVTIDKESYISNVMADGEGRTENFDLSYVALAKQRNCSPEDVEKWMKDNGYTWHEIDDKATLQKVPTHLHACINHSGAVALVKDKYVYYDDELQHRVNIKTLPRANDVLNADKEKIKKADEKLKDPNASKEDKNKAARKLSEANKHKAKTEYRIALMKGTGAESSSGAGPGVLDTESSLTN